jgi:hypothetical protein
LRATSLKQCHTYLIKIHIGMLYIGIIYIGIIRTESNPAFSAVTCLPTPGCRMASLVFILQGLLTLIIRQLSETVRKKP